MAAKRGAEGTTGASPEMSKHKVSNGDDDDDDVTDDMTEKDMMKKLLRDEFSHLVHSINELILPHGTPPITFYTCTHFNSSTWLNQGCLVMWLESINDMGQNIEDQMYEFRGDRYEQKLFEYSLPNEIYHAWTRVRIAFKNVLIHAEL